MTYSKHIIIGGYCDGWDIDAHLTDEEIDIVGKHELRLCPHCLAEYNEDFPPYMVPNKRASIPVNINYVHWLHNEISRINQIPFRDVELFDDKGRIKLSDMEKHDLEYTGLSLCAIIEGEMWEVQDELPR